jgi:hypothetical protein
VLKSRRRRNADERPDLAGEQSRETERHEDEDQKRRQLGDDEGRRQRRKETAFKEEFGHTSRRAICRKSTGDVPLFMLNARAKRCPRQNSDLLRDEERLR